MPVIRDVPLSLKTSEVLRREGFGGHAKIRPALIKYRRKLRIKTGAGGE